MTEVVHHMEREETERQHGLNGLEIEGREMVHPQEGVFGKEVFNAPPFGVGRHGGVGGHVARRGDQREVRAITPLLKQHAQRAIEVCHRRVDGRHVAPAGAVRGFLDAWFWV